MKEHCKLFILSAVTLLTGYREGFLWKRGRDNGQFLSRKFILSEREGAMMYFNKHDVSLSLFCSPSSLVIWMCEITQVKNTSGTVKNADILMITECLTLLASPFLESHAIKILFFNCFLLFLSQACTLQNQTGEDYSVSSSKCI